MDRGAQGPEQGLPGAGKGYREVTTALRCGRRAAIWGTKPVTQIALCIGKAPSHLMPQPIPWGLEVILDEYKLDLRKNFQDTGL